MSAVVDIQWLVKNLLRMGPYSGIISTYSIAVYALTSMSSGTSSQIYWLTIFGFIGVLLVRATRYDLEMQDKFNERARDESSTPELEQNNQQDES